MADARLWILILSAACAEPQPTVDPIVDDGFGVPCENTRVSPVVTCATETGVIGWCVANGEDNGTCRRACVENACPDGQRPTPFFDAQHCFCAP